MPEKEEEEEEEDKGGEKRSEEGWEKKREREAPGRKLKTQKSVEVDLTFMRIDLFCLFLSSEPLRYDVWQLARFVEFGRQCSGSVVVTSSAAVIEYIVNNSKKN